MSSSYVELGGVKVSVNNPKRPELVPSGYLVDEESQSVLSHLQWMLKKESLNQDMFLLGSPGPQRRWLALAFCELLKREAEVISITRDTTESDLKQRREIRDGSAIFSDQGPVRAAIEGRVLILDGIEKAERNVLPTLNCLLESREMQLDDGRFLCPPKRYDELVKEDRNGTLATRLVRVHDHFRVIALGLPVPPFPGKPLDPPLRSRFQARSIGSPPASEIYATLVNRFGVSQAALFRNLSCLSEALADGSDGDSKELLFPPFPTEQLPQVTQLISTFSEIPPSDFIQRIYPLAKGSSHMVNPSNQSGNDEKIKSVASLMERLQLTGKTSYFSGSGKHSSVLPISIERSSSGLGLLTYDRDRKVPGHLGSIPLRPGSESFVSTESHTTALAQLLQSHTAGMHLLLLGGKGSGKSMIAKEFARRLGYEVETFSVFQDMTSRDLFQRRTTDAKGNTIWAPSPLITAALKGHLLILDGVDRLNPETLSVLSRLLLDNEVELFDGSKLCKPGLLQALGVSKSSGSSSVMEIHPSFRVLAIGLPPSISNQWLNLENLSMFSTHELKPLDSASSLHLLSSLFPQVDRKLLHSLIKFNDTLQSSNEEKSIQYSLSIRQLIRVCRKLTYNPSTANLQKMIEDSLMVKFLSPAERKSLESSVGSFVLGSNSNQNSSNGGIVPSMKITTTEDTLTIADVQVKIHKPKMPELVPSPLFFDIPVHVELMRNILQDIKGGEKHLLLIGNQGVGKNKIADRLLQLLNREREYQQLHRDTTIQSLTLSPTLRDGVVVFEDSPLVKAAIHGRVLVIDEADKAPVEVVTVLKGLIEDGELLLADGRKLVDGERYDASMSNGGESLEKSSSLVKISPDFAVWVLANRPGFPFLGNNFFKTIGDVFSTYSISNPDLKSELSLLRHYAPGVDQDVLSSLCNSFNELRTLVSEGVLSYPYSTRELVAVAKHLQMFPKDGVVEVLENVLSFDSNEPTLRRTLSEVFQRNGIPLPMKSSGTVVGGLVLLAHDEPISDYQVAETWDVPGDGVECESVSVSLREKTWMNDSTYITNPIVKNARAAVFSEEKLAWRTSSDDAHGMVYLPSDNSLHVLSSNPTGLHSFRDVGSLKMKQTFLNFEDLIGYHVHSSMQSCIATAATSSPSSPLNSRVFVFIPSARALLSLSSFGEGQNSFVSLEKVIQSASIQRERGGLRNLFDRGGLNDTLSSLNSTGTWTLTGGLMTMRKGGTLSSTLALLQSGSSDIVLIDNDMNVGHRVTLPILCKSVHFSSIYECLLLVDGNDQVHRLSLGTTGAFTLRTFRRNSSRAHLSNLSIPSIPNNIPQEAASSSQYVAFPDMFAGKLVPPSSARNQWSVVASHRHPPSPDGMTYDRSHVTTEGIVVNTFNVIDTQGSGSFFPRKTKVSSILEIVNGEAGQRKSLSIGGVKVIDMCQVKDGDICIVQADGVVRYLQLNKANLMKDLDLYKRMFPANDSSQGKLELVRHELTPSPGSIPRTNTSSPKHGKEDAKNEPHVGGNTWAGGTGGSDTAGLGGRGGPYRLDKGHKVHQVSDADKAAVSQEAREAAEKMRKEAFSARLKEIGMSEADSDRYDAMMSNISQEIAQFRQALSASKAKSKERIWLKHQSSGEIDDSKLIDGLSGDRLVFKKRGEVQPMFDVGSDSQAKKPNRLRFVLDCSGSMYRFNGQDGRLDRMLEAAMLIMESFEGHGDKHKYSIVGHSGDDAKIKLVDYDAPPRNKKEKLKVLDVMAAHAQYCMSGDNTMRAAELAIKEVASHEANEYYMFLLTDANFKRYRIPPSHLKRILGSEKQVQSYAIMIASIGDEAQEVTTLLPKGRGHVCFDTSSLPGIMKNIFMSQLNRED